MDHKPTKTIYQLDTPFTAIQWPEISVSDQDTVLELLVSLLSPMGQHRTSHIIASKGKRSRKRKRKEEKNGKEDQSLPLPPPPEITNNISIGLNSIVRSLEASSRISRPRSAGNESKASGPETPVTEAPSNPSQEKESNHLQDSHFSVIFVLRSSQPTVLHAHLPQLVATASLGHLEHPPTRLVQLPKGCDERLCRAVGLPRVSFIGLLEGAPGSQALVNFVRGCVEPVRIPWVGEVKAGKYLPVKINTIQTVLGTSKKQLPKPKQ